MKEKLTKEYFFEHGAKGCNVQMIARILGMNSAHLYALLSTRPDLMRAHSDGLGVYHDEFRQEAVPLVKEAFLKKIQDGDTKAIIWGMDNLVKIEHLQHPTVRPVTLDSDDARANVYRLNEVSDDEKRARVKSMLTLMKAEDLQ